MSALTESPPTGAGRGAFILFEGIDRCGKTTQVALLDKVRVGRRAQCAWRMTYAIMVISVWPCFVVLSCAVERN